MPPQKTSDPLESLEIRRLFAEWETNTGVLSIGTIPEGHKGVYIPTADEVLEGVIVEGRPNTAMERTQARKEILQEILQVKQKVRPSKKE